MVVGSFTIDGLTCAIGGDGEATLVSVAPVVSDAEDPEGALGSEEPAAKQVPEGGTSPRPPSGSSTGDLAIPASVAYGNTTYSVTAIGAYAFYLSGATEVALPDTVASVDGRAFRSSDVARVEVDEANPYLASCDGALYSADSKSLLLIPEGRAGAVRIPMQAASVPPTAFSHCADVTSIAVDAGGAAFASWDGLLYDASGTTLLRVPAGATGIAIREGCTTIAAGAMEGCAKLERIDAPSTVVSISPDVFASVPTISLPVASLASEPVGPSDSVPQLTAMVALATADALFAGAGPSGVSVCLPDDADEQPWASAGFDVLAVGVSSQSETYPARVYWPKGAGLLWENALSYGSDKTVKANGSVGVWSYYDIASPSAGTSRWNDRLGYYLYRPGNIPNYCRLVGAKAGSISTTPSGPHVATVAANWTALYFRTMHTVSFDTGSSVNVDFGVIMPTISVPKRTGFAFKGYADADGNLYYDETGEGVRAWETYGDGTLYAQWVAIIGVDIPDSVTAKVDLLGIEGQQEAEGYIKSLCGEPLKVVKVECAPQAGAASVFGSRAADVSLEAFAGASAAPAFSFALDATRSEADSSKLAPLTMASLGDSIPIRYRFAIPDDLLSSLVETEAAICQVSYTVALAS